MFRVNIDKKAQADTVFEVLIAVILLSFVLVIGSFAMQSLSTTKCSKEIDISLTNLANIIEQTSSSALGARYFFFDLPNCFGPNGKVEIINKQDQMICSHYCPGSLGSCWLLKYENEKDKVSPTRYRCVNVSTLTIFNSDECEDVDNYSKLTKEDNTGYVIDRGKYLIKSVSIKTPIICIYKKKKGEN